MSKIIILFGVMISNLFAVSIYTAGNSVSTESTSVSGYCFFEADTEGDPEMGIPANPFNLTPEAIELHKSNNTFDYTTNTTDEEKFNSYCRLDSNGNPLSFKDVCNIITNNNTKRFKDNSATDKTFFETNPLSISYNTGDKDFNYCRTQAINVLNQLSSLMKSTLIEDDEVGAINPGEQQEVNPDSVGVINNTKITDKTDNAYTTASSLEELATDLTYKIKQDYLINLGIKRVPRVVMEPSGKPGKYEFRYKSGQTGKYEEGDIMVNSLPDYSFGNKKGIITDLLFPENSPMGSSNKQSASATNYGIFFENEQIENINARVLDGNGVLQNYPSRFLNTLGANHKLVDTPNGWAKLTDNYINRVYANGMYEYGNEIFAIPDTFGGVEFKIDFMPINYSLEEVTPKSGTAELLIQKMANKRCTIDSKTPLKMCTTSSDCDGGTCTNSSSYSDLAEDYGFKTDNSKFAFDGIFAVSGTCGGVSFIGYNSSGSIIKPKITLENLRGECKIDETKLATNNALLPGHLSCGGDGKDFQIKVARTGDDLCKFTYEWPEVPTKIKYSLNDYVFLGAPNTLDKSQKRFDKYDYHTLSVQQGQIELDNILNGLYFGSLLEKKKSLQETAIRNNIMSLSTSYDFNEFKEEVFKKKEGRCVVLDDTTMPLNKNISKPLKGYCNTPLDCCGWELGSDLATTKLGGRVLGRNYSTKRETALACSQRLREQKIYCISPDDTNEAVSSSELKTMIFDAANGAVVTKKKLESWSSLFFDKPNSGISVSSTKPFVCDNTLSKQCENYISTKETRDACYNQPGRTLKIIDGEPRCILPDDKVGSEVRCGLGNNFVNNKCEITVVTCADDTTSDSKCEKFGTRNLEKFVTVCKREGLETADLTGWKQNNSGSWHRLKTTSTTQTQAQRANEIGGYKITADMIRIDTADNIYQKINDTYHLPGIVYSDKMKLNNIEFESTITSLFQHQDDMGYIFGLNNESDYYALVFAGVNGTSYKYVPHTRSQNNHIVLIKYNGNTNAITELDKFSYTYLNDIPYNVKINYTPTKIEAEIKDQTGKLITTLKGLPNQAGVSEFPKGYYGFFNWSKPHVLYGEVKTNPCRNQNFCSEGFEYDRINDNKSIVCTNGSETEIKQLTCPAGYEPDELTETPEKVYYSCKKTTTYCLESYEGDACESDSDCKNEGKCIPNVVGTPEYIFELLDIQSEVSFQKSYDWGNFLVPNSLENLDISFAIDTSGSVDGAYPQVKQIMKDLGNIINYNKVRITLWDGKTNTSWSTNRTSAINFINGQYDGTRGRGDTKNDLAYLWTKSKERLEQSKIEKPTNRRLFVYLGDDTTGHGPAHLTTSKKVEIRDYLNKNDIPSLMLQPLTCAAGCHATSNGLSTITNTTTISGLNHQKLNNIVSNLYNGSSPSRKGRSVNKFNFFKELDYIFVPLQDKRELSDQDIENRHTDFYKTTINKYYWTYKPIFDDGGKWRDTHKSRYIIFNHDRVGTEAIADSLSTISNPIFEQCKREIVSTNKGFTFTEYRGLDSRIKRDVSNTTKEIVNIYTTNKDDLRTKVDEIKQKYKDNVKEEYIDLLFTSKSPDLNSNILSDLGISELQSEMEYYFDQYAHIIEEYSGSYQLKNVNERYLNGHQNIAKLVNASSRKTPDDTRTYMTDKLVQVSDVDINGFNKFLGDYFDIDTPLDTFLLSPYQLVDKTTNSEAEYQTSSNATKYRILENTVTNKISFLTQDQYIKSYGDGYLLIKDIDKLPSDDTSEVNLYIPILGEKTSVKIEVLENNITDLKVTDKVILNTGEVISFNDTLISNKINNGTSIEFDVNKKNIYLFKLKLAENKETKIKIYLKSLNIDLYEDNRSVMSYFIQNGSPVSYWLDSDYIRFENIDKMLLTEKEINDVNTYPELKDTNINKNWYSYNVSFNGALPTSQNETVINTDYNDNWDKLDNFILNNTQDKEIYEKEVYLEKDGEISIKIDNKENTFLGLSISNAESTLVQYTTPENREINVLCPKDSYFDSESNKCVYGIKSLCSEGEKYIEETQECEKIINNFCVANETYNSFDVSLNTCISVTDEEMIEDDKNKICIEGTPDYDTYECKSTKPACSYIDSNLHVSGDLSICVVDFDETIFKDITCEENFEYNETTKKCEFVDVVEKVFVPRNSEVYRIRILKEQKDVLPENELSSITITDNLNTAKEMKCDNGLNTIEFYNGSGKEYKCIDGINEYTLKKETKSMIDKYKKQNVMMAYRVDKFQESTGETKIQVKYKPTESYIDKKLEEVEDVTTIGTDNIVELCQNALAFNFIGEDEKIRQVLKGLRTLRNILTTTVEYHMEPHKGLGVLDIPNNSTNRANAAPMKNLLLSPWIKNSWSVYHDKRKEVGHNTKYQDTCTKMKIKLFKIYYTGCATGTQMGDNYCNDVILTYPKVQVPLSSTASVFSRVKKLFVASYKGGLVSDSEGNTIMTASDLFDLLYNPTNSGETEIAFDYEINGVKKQFKMNKVIGTKDFNEVINPVIDRDKYTNIFKIFKHKRCQFVTHSMGHLVAKYLTNMDKKIERLDSFVKSFINTKEFDKCVMDLSQKQHAQIDRDYFNLGFVGKYTSHMKPYAEDEEHWSCYGDGTEKAKKCDIVKQRNIKGEIELQVKMFEETNEAGISLCKTLIPNITLGDDSGVNTINRHILNTPSEANYLRMENYRMKQDNEKVNYGQAYKDLYGISNPYQTKICDGYYGLGGISSNINATNGATSTVSGSATITGLQCIKQDGSLAPESISNNMYREFIDVMILDNKDMKVDIEVPEVSNILENSGFIKPEDIENQGCNEIVEIKKKKFEYTKKLKTELCASGVPVEEVYTKDISLYQNQYREKYTSEIRMSTSGSGINYLFLYGKVPLYSEVKDTWELGGFKGNGFMASTLDPKYSPVGKKCKVSEDYVENGFDAPTNEQFEPERLQYKVEEIDMIGKANCNKYKEADYELVDGKCVYVEKIEVISETIEYPATVDKVGFKCPTGGKLVDETCIKETKACNVTDAKDWTSYNVLGEWTIKGDYCQREVTRIPATAYECPKETTTERFQAEINIDTENYMIVDITTGQFSSINGDNYIDPKTGKSYSNSPGKCARLVPYVQELNIYHNEMVPYYYCPEGWIENSNYNPDRDPVSEQCYREVEYIEYENKSKNCYTYGEIEINTIDPQSKNYQAMFETINVIDMIMSKDKSSDKSKEVASQVTGDLLEEESYDQKTRLELLEESCNEFKNQYVTRDLKTSTILDEKGVERESNTKIFVNKSGLKKQCIAINEEEPSTPPITKYCLNNNSVCPTGYECRAKWSEGNPFVYKSKMCISDFDGEWHGKYCFEEDKNPCGIGYKCKEKTRAINKCEDIYLTKEQAKKQKSGISFDDLKESLEKRNIVMGARKTDGTREEEDTMTGEKMTVELFKDKTNKTAALNAQEATIEYNRQKAITNDGISKEIKDGQVTIDKRIKKEIGGQDEIIDSREGMDILKQKDMVEGSGSGTLQTPSTLQKIFGGDMEMDFDDMSKDALSGEQMKGAKTGETKDNGSEVEVVDEGKVDKFNNSMNYVQKNEGKVNQARSVIGDFNDSSITRTMSNDTLIGSFFKEKKDEISAKEKAQRTKPKEKLEIQEKVIIKRTDFEKDRNTEANNTINKLRGNEQTIENKVIPKEKQSELEQMESYANNISEEQKYSSLRDSMGLSRVNSNSMDTLNGALSDHKKYGNYDEKEEELDLEGLSYEERQKLLQEKADEEASSSTVLKSEYIDTELDVDSKKTYDMNTIMFEHINLIQGNNKIEGVEGTNTKEALDIATQKEQFKESETPYGSGEVDNFYINRN